MKVLAIETSTSMCSVALAVAGEVRSRRQLAPRGHASLLLPWTDELLAEAGLDYGSLDQLAVGRGPGGFTSLRIGLGVAQGIALAHDLPVVPVSSLAVLAQGTQCGADRARVLALIDARMGEVFAGWFEQSGGQLRELAPEAVMAPQQLDLPEADGWMVAGSGLAAYSDMIRARLGDSVTDWRPDVWPLAEALIVLAERLSPVPAWQVEPNYVRDRVTQS